MAEYLFRRATSRRVVLVLFYIPLVLKFPITYTGQLINLTKMLVKVVSFKRSREVSRYVRDFRNLQETSKFVKPIKSFEISADPPETYS